MSYRVDRKGRTRTYHQQLNDLRKKHPKVDRDLERAFDELARDPFACGDVIPGLDLPQSKRAVKVRVSSTDMGRGKSGGFRLIVLVDEDDKSVCPFVIYRKADMEQPPPRVMRAWLQEALLS